MGTFDFLFGKKQPAKDKKNERLDNETNDTNTNNASLINIIGGYFTLQSLKMIPIGSEYSMRPLDGSLFLDDTNITMLTAMGDSTGIKRYLPNTTGALIFKYCL